MKLFCSAFVLLLSIAPSELKANFLIYTVDFSPTSQTPGFKFYESGWIIADLKSEKTSFVFTLKNADTSRPGKGFFVISQNTGDFFFSSEGETLSGNIRAISKNAVAQTSYLLTGSIDTVIKGRDAKTGVRRSVSVPAVLSGFLLASAVDQYQEGNSAAEEKMNLIGMMKITATLEESSTSYFNHSEMTIDQIIDYIRSDLLKASYLEEELE
ncbi:MAG: hypothetical protein P1V20_13225 [Verrucomicrobiales bacterium]|nr:hypothetical protein [Verrucomicrobiales bacterium]